MAIKRTALLIIVLVASRDLAGDPKAEPEEAKNAYKDIQKLVLRQKKAEALEMAAKLAQASPGDPRLPRSLHALRVVPGGPDAKERKTIEASARKLLLVLQRAFEAAPRAGVGMNLVEIMILNARSHLNVGLLDSEKMKSTVLNVAGVVDSGPAMYVILAKYYHVVEKDYHQFERMLRNAEHLAFKAEYPSDLRVEVAHMRARVLLERRGKTPSAIAGLCRVVQLDERFGCRSNWALDRLGEIALARGNVALAKMYLSLAARARPDAVLRSFGYAKGLALSMIREGHTDAALRYLETARGVEELPNHETYYGLGMAYFSKGDMAEAVKWLQAYLDLRFRPQESVVRNVLNSARGMQSSRRRMQGGDSKAK